MTVGYCKSLHIDIIDRCGHPHVEIVRFREGDEVIPIMVDLTSSARDLADTE